MTQTENGDVFCVQKNGVILYYGNPNKPYDPLSRIETFWFIPNPHARGSKVQTLPCQQPE